MSVIYEIYGKRYVLTEGREVEVVDFQGNTEYFMYDYEHNMLMKKKKPTDEYHIIYNSRTAKYIGLNYLPSIIPTIAAFAVLALVSKFV